MTGAGSSTLAWAAEDSYLGGTSNPTYYLPGTNANVETAELTRNLLEIVAPGDVETQNFLAQQLEGQLSVSFILKNDDFHRLIFNNSFTGFTSGTVNSAEWYLGVDYIGGTTERQIKGWVPATANITYNGATESVRVTMSGPYGDEVENTSITPGTISDNGTEVPGHGTSLSINATSIGDRLQSATLTFENISRLIRGASQKPVEAVAGDVRSTLDVQSVYNGPGRYELALGGPSASTVQADVDEVPATLTFDEAGGTQVAQYEISAVAPESYDWQDLVNNDADLNEAVNFRGRGISGSDPTV